jgi:hypothetical protein
MSASPTAVVPERLARRAKALNGDGDGVTGVRWLERRVCTPMVERWGLTLGDGVEMMECSLRVFC